METLAIIRQVLREESTRLTRELLSHAPYYADSAQAFSFPKFKTAMKGTRYAKKCFFGHDSLYDVNVGSEVISLIRWPHFTPRKIPGAHVC
jgi:hypothetical protein